MRSSHSTPLSTLMLVAAVCGAMTLGWQHAAQAQGYGDPQPIMQPQGAPGQPVVVAQPQPQPQMQPAPAPANARQGRGFEYGGHLVVPFFITNSVAAVVDSDGDVIGPADAGIGVGIQGRLGWEFGAGFTVELNLGGTFNVMEGEELGTGISIDVDTTLRTYWLGAGIRYSFLGESALVPFVGGGVGLYFVDFCPNNAPSCSFEPTFGANALAGIIYEISPFVGVEAGLQATLMGSNDLLVETEVFLAPFVGATLYY